MTMYSQTKRLTKIGGNSKALIIPSEWCFAMGVTLGSHVHMEYNALTRSIMLRPLNNGANVYGDNNAIDCTPTPRRKLEQSPHPKYTAAKWAELEPWFKQTKLKDLEHMQELGIDNTTVEGCDAYEIWRSQNNALSYKPIVEARTFEEIPDATRGAFLEDIEPHLIYNTERDKTTARNIWLGAYNTAIHSNDKKEYLRLLTECHHKLLKSYNKQIAQYDTLEDEL